MRNSTLHIIEASVLYTLRHSESARFSDLMRPTGLESDVFKFHLRKLMSAGYIEKLATGHYRLTPVGKEFANNLDKTTQTVQKQPKLSLYLVISRQTQKNKTEFLFQKRLRNPFYGYWGCLSGPAKWGEELEKTATHELKKQTGLTASFTVQSFLRVKDYDTDSNTILEDKLFAILLARRSEGQLTDSWSGGSNQWMTIDELQRQPLHFKTTENVIHTLQTNQVYTSQKQIYNVDEY